MIVAGRVNLASRMKAHPSELHARDLAALLDASKIERAHFVGLSNGGLVLMHFAKLLFSWILSRT